MRSRTPSLAAPTTRRACRSRRRTTHGAACPSAGDGAGAMESPFAAPATGTRDRSATTVRRSSSCAAMGITRAAAGTRVRPTLAATVAMGTTVAMGAAVLSRARGRTVHRPATRATLQHRPPEEPSASPSRAADARGCARRHSERAQLPHVIPSERSESRNRDRPDRGRLPPGGAFTLRRATCFHAEAQSRGPRRLLPPRPAEAQRPTDSDRGATTG